MSTDLKADSADEVSRESEHHGCASEVAQASLWLLEEHQRNVTALRQALIGGENSGEAVDLDIKKIKANARQR